MDDKMVKSPKHYTEGRKFEPKDVIRDWGLNFNLGSAVKYLARAGRKDDIIQDLSKAKEYIDFEIAAIKEQRAGKMIEAQKEAAKKESLNKVAYDVAQAVKKKLAEVEEIGTQATITISVDFEKPEGGKNENN